MKLKLLLPLLLSGAMPVYGHVNLSGTGLSPDMNNGTVTVYGLFPKSSYSPSDALFDISVNASYRVDNSTTISDIMVDGSICGEESKPDGIIQITTDIKTDKSTKMAMDALMKQHKYYQGRSFNCSTFAREGVKTATGKEIKGEENYHGMNYVTPNALFNETKKIEGSKIVLSPDDRTNYEFKTMVKEYKNEKK